MQQAFSRSPLIQILSILHPKFHIHCTFSCYVLNCVPPKDVQVLTPDTCECDLIWKRTFADDQVERRSLKQTPPVRLVFSWKEEIGRQACTQGECHVNMKARIRAVLLRARECRRLQQTARSYRRWNRFPSWPSGEANPARTWIWGFWPPEPWDNTFLLFKLPNFWYFVRMALTN